MRGGEPIALKATRLRGRMVFSPVSLSEVRERQKQLPPATTCLSAGESLVQWVSAPFSSISKARRILPTLLDIAMPFALEDCVVTFLDVHRAADRKSVASLAVAARHAQVAARLDACRQHGFDPVALDQEALVLWTQSIFELPDTRGETCPARAVLSAEDGRYCLALGRGARLAGTHSGRTLAAGELLRILKARLGPEALPVRWCLCGSKADSPEVMRVIAEGIPAEWRKTVETHETPREFVARGLATRALLRGPMRVNLRGTRFVHAVAERQARYRARAAAAMVLAASVLICAADITAVARLRSARSGLGREFASLRDRILGYRLDVKGDRAVGVIAAELEKRREQIRPFSEAFEPSLVARAGRIMELADTDSLKLDSLVITARGVTLSGTAPRWNGWTGLMSYLTAEGYGAAVTPGPAGGNGRTSFSIATGRNVE
jgi:hypothetical protein